MKRHISGTGPLSLLAWMMSHALGYWTPPVPRRFWRRGQYWFGRRWQTGTPWRILYADADIRRMLWDNDEVALLAAYETEVRNRLEAAIAPSRDAR